MPKKVLPLVLLLLFAVSCDRKKERLANDTLTISIDTQVSTMEAGSKTQLKALCSSAHGDVNVSPTWSVENTMGTCSPTQGTETTFNAGNSTGTVKVFACYGSIRGETTITIAEKCTGTTGGSSGGSGGSGGSGTGGTGTTSGTTGGTGGSGEGLNESTPANYYGLLSETYVIPGILLDTNSSRFPDGGCLGVWPDAYHTVLSDATGAGEFTEGTKALKCWIGITGGGWWLQFGSDAEAGLSDCDEMKCRDMTAFTGGALKFDIKTTQNIMIGVQWGIVPKNMRPPSADVTLEELGVPIDGKWHSVSIPLSRFSGLCLNLVKVPASFSAAPGCISFPFWVDNVRWEKCP